jgi:hypothetical protein
MLSVNDGQQYLRGDSMLFTYFPGLRVRVGVGVRVRVRVGVGVRVRVRVRVNPSPSYQPRVRGSS